MSNLGPHLRHNLQHTLFLVQEQPCSQFGLHMHDQQPLQLHLNIRFTVLQHTLFVYFTVGKTLKKRYPKMDTDPHKLLAINPMNLGILLQSTTKSSYQLTIGQPSFSLQSVATSLPIDLLLVHLFNLLFMSLLHRTTSTFEFKFTRSNHLDLRLVVDPP